MKVVTTIAEVREAVTAAKAKGLVVGFVPTMGALHRGHTTLVDVCKRETGFVVASIFVNPTQFGPNEDFSRYPRPFETDLALCEASGVDLVFAPEVDEMYPGGEKGTTIVDVEGVSERLEGASRPGHFRGVTTVVMKLFGIVQPDRAYFGAKDYQQQLVIRRMVADLNVPVAIRTVATVREPDGLALSSRNRYLDPEQRRAATVLSQALTAAKKAVAAGERDAKRVRQVLTETIESERRADLIYAEVADADTLEPLNVIPPDQRAVALLAVRVGTTRLIDNLVLTD